MADKYSTIQQHQPLRVPSGWDRQEKALIVQLDEIFDDIYRRFGRLRMEDMGKAFQKRIEDDEGNIAELVIDVGQITIDVGNKYDKVSGITINADGIDVTGSKYVKIRSGGTFDVDSTNFKISSTEKKIISGAWKFDDSGMYCTPTNADYNFAITKTSGALPNKTVGIVFEADSTASYASGTLKFSTGAFHGSNFLTGTLILSSDLTESKLYPNDDNQMYLGISGKRFKDAYLYKLHCSDYYVASLFNIHFSYSNVSLNLGMTLDTQNQHIVVGGSPVWYYGKFKGNADTASEADILKWQAPPSYNFNNLTSTGQYVVGMSNMSNSPTSTGTGYIEVIAGSTHILQRVFTKGSIYIREYTSDYGSLAWTAWRYVSLSAV